MDFSSLPLAVLVLLPGFVSIYSGFLVSRFRRLAGFQGATWSLATSFLIIIVVYPIYTNVVEPPTDQPWPGLIDMVREPTLMPGSFVVSLYIFGPLLSVIVGFVDRNQGFERMFSFIGLDLRVHGDLWARAIRDTYVRVYLKEGDLIYGWPEFYSVDRQPPGPEIYLSQVRIWDTATDNWVPLEEDSSVLVHGDQISRIELLGLPK